MEIDGSIRKADGRILAVMVAVLAGLVGLAGYSMTEDQAAVASAPVASETRIAGKTATDAPQVWSSDDSANGTGPNSAH